MSTPSQQPPRTAPATPLLVVCMKSVRRSDVPVRLREDGQDLHPGDAAFTANAADLAALHCALTLKQDVYGGEAHLLALCYGPRTGEEVLRHAQACGADETLRIWRDWEGGGEPPWLQGTRSHARILGDVIRQLAPRVVLTGDRSADHGSEGFGPFLAAALRADFARRAVSVAPREQGLEVQVRVERGYRQTLRLNTPAVITVAAQGPRPPEPSLRAWIAAREADIPILRVDEPPPSPVEVTLRAPLPRVKQRSDLPRQTDAEQRIAQMIAQDTGAEGHVMTEGAPADQAEAVFELLKARGYLDRS